MRSGKPSNLGKRKRIDHDVKEKEQKFPFLKVNKTGQSDWIKWFISL